MSLDGFLDDLARLRADLSNGPVSRRAIAARCDREPVGLLAVPAGPSRAQLQIYASESPKPHERSVLHVEIDPAGLHVGDDLVGVAELYGSVSPGHAIVCCLGQLVLWPAGPARAELRGRPWRGRD